MPRGVPNKKYTGEFKQRVVEDVIENKLSQREAATKYGITNKTQVAMWERIYLTEGAEGLYIDRRGRSKASGGLRNGRPPKFPKQVEEDLLAEVQRLRAENDYLKKLNALVSERVQREKKSK